MLFPKKGGGLRAHNAEGRRLLVGVLLSLGLLGMPLLLLSTGAAQSAAPGNAGGGRTAAGVSTRPDAGALANLKLAFQIPSSTTTTAVPPSTTAAAAPTTTAAVPPPPPTTTTTTAASTDMATGIATWYSEAPAGTCASPWLPKGVTLTVTDIASGVTITCLVADREADNPGRVVDLSPSGFEALAPLSAGVVQVTVSW